MTDDERQRAIQAVSDADGWDPEDPGLPDGQLRLILLVIECERERCAKVAEAFRGGYTASLDGDYLVPDPDGPWSLSSDIAAAIRATPGGGP